MTKVLHVYRTYYPTSQGGLEEVIRQICWNSQAHDVESVVFALANSPSERPIRRPEATVIQGKQHLEISSCDVSFNSFARFKKLVMWADVVQYHFPWPFADVLHLSSGERKPSVVTYHSDIVRQRALGWIYRPLMHRFLASMDRIVCTSPNYFATSDVLTRYSEKVDVIPIGIEEAPHAPMGDAQDETESGVLIPNRPYFLFVGVLRYYKGLHILLEAARGAEYDVVIAGSGPTEKDLKRQVESQAIDNVRFTGRVSEQDKARLIDGALAIVFPSYLRAEAFGVTLLEGAMRSKPLISAEVGTGTSHINVHGETGLVVPPGSPKVLRSAMDKIFRNPALAHRMGNAARARYELLFTGKLMGQRYAKVYKELADGKNDCGKAS